MAVGITEGDGVFGPQYEVPSWFNGMVLTNRGTVAMVVRSAEVMTLEGDLKLIDILFARGSEVTDGIEGAFTGTCGREPPDGYRWHQPEGLAVLPGERILPVVAVEGGSGKVRDLRITYNLGTEDETFVQEIYFLGEVRNEEKTCPPNGHSL